MRYNVEATIECRSKEGAEGLAAFVLYSGFIPFVDGTVISILAKNVDRYALDYLIEMVESDERVVNSSFHRTPF